MIIPKKLCYVFEAFHQLCFHLLENAREGVWMERTIKFNVPFHSFNVPLSLEKVKTIKLGEALENEVLDCAASGHY